MQPEEQKPNIFTDYKQPSKWKLILLYVLFFPIILAAKGAVEESKRQRHFNKKYKKMIKKGLFWDTTYYIERD